jgi:thioredoxin/glutathione reductase (selenoprotein)
MTDRKYDYDLVVIGGGSGGIACARKANQYGAKVAVLDFVTPTPRGFSWGLGGTCVNVGCIPKKLFHTSALYREIVNDAKSYGWDLPDTPKLNWEQLVAGVQDHICSTNWKYETDLRRNKIKYINALGSLVDAHTIETTDYEGQKSTITADKIVIAVGGRPVYPEIPGAKEYGVTSDDIFALEKPPGKTLVIGAAYVALECAGFLTGLGYDVTVMVRSIVLRGFDRECANKIQQHMKEKGTKFLQPAEPLSVKKGDNGLVVKYFVRDEKDLEKVTEHEDTFDTVLFAIGRRPETKRLNLDKIGVKLDASGKIIVNEYEQTSVDNIFAIGDVIKGGLELTPVAIKAGQLLADRLFNINTTKPKMDYVNVPTTVFTPLEYGSCGLSEEAAKQKFGTENLVIYKKTFTVLEYTVPYREEKGFIKLICNAKDNERVVGFHILSPNAGEITQAIGIAMKLGATKEDFDSTIGIHPTVAEVMTKLELGVEEETGC